LEGHRSKKTRSYQDTSGEAVTEKKEVCWEMSVQEVSPLASGLGASYLARACKSGAMLGAKDMMVRRT
jgi:hypothetical protein